MNTKPPSGDRAQLKAVTDATLSEGALALTKFCQWLQASPPSLSNELHDRLGIRLLTMVESLEQLCWRAAEAELMDPLEPLEARPMALPALADGSLAPTEPPPNYTELAQTFGLMRANIRVLMAANPAQFEIDPALRALLDKLRPCLATPSNF